MVMVTPLPSRHAAPTACWSMCGCTCLRRHPLLRRYGVLCMIRDYQMHVHTDHVHRLLRADDPLICLCRRAMLTFVLLPLLRLAPQQYTKRVFEEKACFLRDVVNCSSSLLQVSYILIMPVCASAHSLRTAATLNVLRL
jgi:hypothetical protein